MAELNRTPLSHPETPAEALEVLDILVRAYVPKNTKDAKYMMAALNVLRVDAARTNAATRVMLGIELGRMAQRAAVPREFMKDESQRIGWDEAEYDATNGVAPARAPERVKVGELILPGINGPEYDDPDTLLLGKVMEQLQERLVRGGKDRVLDLFVEVPAGVPASPNDQPKGGA